MFRPSVGRVSLAVLVGVAACVSGDSRARSDVDIVSRSRITGSVNGRGVEATVAATLNTGRGGSSTCTFSRLPQGFNPGTFGTHT
jgi:hypothetical protein